MPRGVELYWARPHAIPLSHAGALQARCQLCGELTGATAYAQHQVVGLYCSPGHAASAVEYPRLMVPQKYRAVTGEAEER